MIRYNIVLKTGFFKGFMTGIHFYDYDAAKSFIKTYNQSSSIYKAKIKKETV